MKIAFIGAGSISFCRQIFTDIMTVGELREAKFAFTDINPQNLEMVRALCQRDVNQNGFNNIIEATTDRKVAFMDANFIINCIRPGGLEAFEQDINIPLKYGVDQCVGDTLCVGGIMYAQRGIRQMLDICEDIRLYSAKDVILLNYSNPNAMITWACNEYGGVNTVGLCHGEMHGEMQIAEVLGYNREELDFICAGINHQTWYISVKHKGIELKDKLLEALENHPKYSKEEKVRIDVLKRFGYYSTESNGHLSEYLAWYRKRDMEKWIDLDCWINGETGGYLRLCTESRDWFMTDYPNWMQEPPRSYDKKDRSIEHASYIIEALCTGRIYRGHFNVVNKCSIENLPQDCIVEVPCYVDGNGIFPLSVGKLPLGCAAILSQSVNVQRIAVIAAVEGNEELLKQATLLDPLTSAVCTTEEVWQMIDEMLIAQKEWLPQYKEAIEKAEINLKTAKKEGKLVKPNSTQGCKKPVRTIEEMAKNAVLMRKMVANAAKEMVEE